MAEGETKKVPKIWALRIWPTVYESLSGRILLLTILFVMSSVALIYFPSVARYHHQLLVDHVAAAEIAILPFTEEAGEQLSERMRLQLLARAGVEAVVLRGRGAHELYLAAGDPPAVDAIFNADADGLLEQIGDVIDCLMAPPHRIIRIDADTALQAGRMILVVANEAQIRTSLLTFSTRVLVLSIFISGLTSLLVFVSLYRAVVMPMKKLINAMAHFRADPEDSNRILQPSKRRDEVGTAERELARLQSELYGFLQQKKRLAALGSAVAKIQHDLRNILSSAQIASDRLAELDDPVAKTVTPRLVGALDRAVALATSVLRYGKAEEPAPQLRALNLKDVADDAVSAALEGAKEVAFENRIPAALRAELDAEQVFRIVLNLVTNAREAMQRAGTVKPRIVIEGTRMADFINLKVRDNGPGIIPARQEKLFQPFAAALPGGGSGLGLAIARELARGHGGDVTLEKTDETGTEFHVNLPC